MARYAVFMFFEGLFSLIKSIFLLIAWAGKEKVNLTVTRKDTVPVKNSKGDILSMIYKYDVEVERNDGTKVQCEIEEKCKGDSLSKYTERTTYKGAYNEADNTCISMYHLKRTIRDNLITIGAAIGIVILCIVILAVIGSMS